MRRATHISVFATCTPSFSNGVLVLIPGQGDIVYSIPLALSFNIVLSYKVKFWVPIRIENAAKCNKCTKSSCRIVVLFNLLNC